MSAAEVAVHSSVSVDAHLATSSGAPIANHRIWLIERVVGSGTATQIAMGLTGADGSVVLTATDLTHSVRLRLNAGQGVHSAPVLVVVVPTVTASVSAQGSTYAVSVTTDGGNLGDTVRLQRRTARGWVGVATAQLDSSAAASFSVAAPPKRTQHYRVILARTPAHAAAMTSFATPPL